MRLIQFLKITEGFSTSRTGMPTFDDMIKDPEYFRTAKKKVFNIINIPPSEYIDRAVRGFNWFTDERDVTRETLMRSRDSALIDKYAKALAAGDEFPMVVLDYTRGDFSQEGLHRAAAAEKAGMDVIPVMMVNDAKQLSEQFTSDQTALKNYLSSDRMELDVFLHWEEILNWLDENHPEIGAKIDRDDPYQWYELPQEIQIEFEQDMGEQLQQEQMQHDPANVDTKAHLSFNRMIKTLEWYVHFSNDAESIASNGFTQGVDDMTKLGLTTYLGKNEKEYGGYNFAFMANSRDAMNSSTDPNSYGGDFVMFNMRGALEVDHHADEETQYIVYGKDIDRRNLIFVSHDGGGNYNVMVHPSKEGRYARDRVTGELTYEEAIAWVAKHIDQYRKVITGW